MTPCPLVESNAMTLPPRAPAALPGLSLIALAVLLAACAPADPATQAARAARDAARTPAVTVLGPGENCITQSQVRQSIVRSETVIDFEMRSGKVYRSTLPNRCPGLTLDRAISWDNSIDQLCRQQIVYSLQNFAGTIQRGAGCGLGEFVPVEYVKKAKG
jgi:hypothetical protein